MENENTVTKVKANDIEMILQAYNESVGDYTRGNKAWQSYIDYIEHDNNDDGEIETYYYYKSPVIRME